MEMHSHKPDLFILKEIKEGEGRVAAVPDHVSEYVAAGARVFVEKGAGVKSGFPDDLYGEAGATLLDRRRMLEIAEDYRDLQDVLFLKVKELQPSECDIVRDGVTVMGFGHLASNEPLARAMLERNGVYISLEDIVENDRRPVLAAMSEIAGREAVRLGRRHHTIQSFPAFVLIGYGNAGRAAHCEAYRLHVAPVHVVEPASAFDAEKREHYWKYSNTHLDLHLFEHKEDEVIRAALREARGSRVGDSERALIVILSPYIPERTAPKIMKRNMLPAFPRGSVIVDISIDQGGACEFSRPTTHEEPVAMINGVKYIGIPNLPGAVPESSAPRLSEVMRPYVLEIASKGVVQALRDSSQLRGAVSIWRGTVASPGLAEMLGLTSVSLETVI